MEIVEFSWNCKLEFSDVFLAITVDPVHYIGRFFTFFVSLRDVSRYGVCEYPEKEIEEGCRLIAEREGE